MVNAHDHEKWLLVTYSALLPYGIPRWRTLSPFSPLPSPERVLVEQKVFFPSFSIVIWPHTSFYEWIMTVKTLCVCYKTSDTAHVVCFPWMFSGWGDSFFVSYSFYPPRAEGEDKEKNKYLGEDWIVSAKTRICTQFRSKREETRKHIRHWLSRRMPT